MDANTEELKEIWKNTMPQDFWASVQRVSQLIDANSLDYCIKRWMDESNLLYNTINNIHSTEENTPLMDSSIEDNLLDNLIGPYRKCELMLALLLIKKRNLAEFKEKIEKILQLARQDAENDKLNKNFIGSIASAIKNCITTQGGQYNCEIEKDDKCFEKGIKKVMASLPEYPKCNPPTLMYIKHKPDDEFINKTGVKWKSKFSIPNEKIRMELLEKKIPGITVTSPSVDKPQVKKEEEKPSFLMRRKPSYSFLRNSSNRPTMRQNSINIPTGPSGGGSLIAKKNKAPKKHMLLDLEEVNRLHQIQEEEKRLAQKREEEEKAAAEREKERKKKEDMARKQREKEERERERMEKRKKKQKEAEEEKKRKEAIKEAKEKEAKEKEKKRQEAIAAAKEAKEKEAKEKELRKLKEKEAKEKEKREKLLQRENSVTSPTKRRTRKKRRLGNESVNSSVNSSEATTPVLSLNRSLEDRSDMNMNGLEPNNMNLNNNGNNEMNPFGTNDYYRNQDPNPMQNPEHSNGQDYYDPHQPPEMNHPNQNHPYYNQQQPPQHHQHPQQQQQHLQHPHQHPSAMDVRQPYDPHQQQPDYPPPPPPAYHNNMHEYDEILGSTNQLNMEQRQFIIDFLNGKKVAEPNETKVIPLNVETYKDREANLLIKEIIEFEMNFQSGTWRKLKKIKKTLINAKE